VKNDENLATPFVSPKGQQNERGAKVYQKEVKSLFYNLRKVF
jgi:hypothetical protein